MTKPLPLNSPLWSELAHAYGIARDIPELLRKLEMSHDLGGPNDEPMFMLWSSLYHQGDVYSASFAAFPHLIQIAVGKKAGDREKILMLAGSIAAASDDPTPFLRTETKSAYFEARTTGLKLMCELFVESECSEFEYWLGSLAALKGKAAFARTLFSLELLVDSALRAKIDFPIDAALVKELGA